MVDAHRGDDDIAFYAASLGLTTVIAVTDVAGQTTDADGALAPGRYLLHVASLGAGVIWVATGKFVKGGPQLPIVAGVPHFPMQTTGILAIEINIVKGDSDRIAAIANSSASGSLFITQISRGA